MPGRRKEKIKTKKERKAELESEDFDYDVRFDYVRFAYDVLMYSAEKFGIQPICLAVWDCPPNDYGGNDNFKSLTRNIISKQRPLRYYCYRWFQDRLRMNKFESSKGICKVLQYCMKTFRTMKSIVCKVECSLSVACELILFLHSEDKHLHLKELAECWFKCYFKGERYKFEMAGGIDKMLESGRNARDVWSDELMDQFIVEQCLDYEKTKLIRQMDDAFVEYYNTCRVNDLGLVGCIPSIDLNEFRYMPILQPEQASSLNLPQNTGLGIAPHDELLQAFGPSIASSQNPLESSSEVRPRHSRGLSSQERRRRNRNYSSRPPSEQDTGQSSLDSSEAIQSSERTPSVSGAKDAAPNYNLLGAKPKERGEKSTESSSLQPDMSSLFPSVEQDLGQLSLDSPDTTQSIEEKPSVSAAKHKTTTCNIATRPKIPTESSRESSNLQTSRSSLRSSVEQGPGQLSLDSSNTTHSIEEKPSVSAAKDQTSSQNLPSTSHQEPRQEHRGSSSQEKKKKKSKKNKQSD